MSGRVLGARLPALGACAVGVRSERSIGHDSRLHLSRRERETGTLIRGYGTGSGGRRRETGWCGRRGLAWRGPGASGEGGGRPDAPEPSGPACTPSQRASERASGLGPGGSLLSPPPERGGPPAAPGRAPPARPCFLPGTRVKARPPPPPPPFTPRDPAPGVPGGSGGCADRPSPLGAGCSLTGCPGNFLELVSLSVESQCLMQGLGLYTLISNVKCTSLWMPACRD